MAKADLPAPPVTERGYANPFPGFWSTFGQSGEFEDVDDLLWPSSVRTYTRMYRGDTRVASVLSAIWLPVRCTNWWIEPNGARDEVVEFVATDLGLPIRGHNEDETKPRTVGRSAGRFSWQKHLQLALKYLQFGHQVFERTYMVDDAGRAHLSRLGPRPSSTIAFWDVAANGDLMGVQQWPMGTLMSGPGGQRVIGSMPLGQRIPADRLTVYVRDQDPGIWFGNSILRQCYVNWLLKGEFMRIEAAAARRHGIGVPKVNVSERESQDPARMKLYGDIAKGWTSGASAGVAFPSGTDAHIMGPEGNMPAGFIRQAIEYHDKSMALGAMLHFMNLDRGGSYALASSLTDPWIQATQTVADDIKSTTQETVVEDIVTVNWGPDEPVPLLGSDAIGARQDLTAAALQILATAGIITPDGRLEAFERQQLGLPPADPQTAEPGDVGGDAGEAMGRQRQMGEPTNSVHVASHTRRRPAARRVTIEPDGGLTLW